MKKTTLTIISTAIWGSCNAFAQQSLEEQKEWIDISAHLRVVGAISSGELEELAAHGHDPNQDVLLQSLELGASFDINNYIKGFAAVTVFQDTEDSLAAEWEEGYVRFVNLPGGLEIRGGRYFNRFGRQNQIHLHGWDFVDSNLPLGSFLGEEGLITEGGEISWFWEGPVVSALSLSFGNALEHEEEAGGAEELGEEAFLSENIFTGRWLLNWNPSDFHRYELGFNLGLGENGYGRQTQVYSLDAHYTFREDGYDTDGKSLTVGGELFYRNVNWNNDNMGVITTGDAAHLGLTLNANAYLGQGWEAGLRYDWIEGVADGPSPTELAFEIEERTRYSAALTKRFELSDQLSTLVRVQANFDEVPQGEEQSIFLQFGIDWGATKTH